MLSIITKCDSASKGNSSSNCKKTIVKAGENSALFWLAMLGQRSQAGNTCHPGVPQSQTFNFVRTPPPHYSDFVRTPHTTQKPLNSRRLRRRTGGGGRGHRFPRSSSSNNQKHNIYIYIYIHINIYIYIYNIYIHTIIMKRMKTKHQNYINK